MADPKAVRRALMIAGKKARNELLRDTPGYNPKLETFLRVGEVPEGEHLIPLGKGKVVREGADVTIVAIGAMVRRAVSAAKELEAAGISAEVIDPRTLHPLDDELIVSSVRKTGRIVVVDEARQSCSMASEIVARVCQQAFSALTHAPRIIANPDVHVPYAAALEEIVIPQIQDIIDVTTDVMLRSESI